MAIARAVATLIITTSKIVTIITINFIRTLLHKFTVGLYFFLLPNIFLPVSIPAPGKMLCCFYYSLLKQHTTAQSV